MKTTLDKPAFPFDNDGSVYFQSRHDGKIRFFRDTWEQHILVRPERGHFRFNAEKIPTTLVNPDYVRESLRDGPDGHLYYKAFPTWKLSEGLEIPSSDSMRFMVVIVSTVKKLILTTYLTGRIKAGKKVEA